VDLLGPRSHLSPLALEPAHPLLAPLCSHASSWFKLVQLKSEEIETYQFPIRFFTDDLIKSLSRAKG
jgi:hypothetical protein